PHQRRIVFLSHPGEIGFLVEEDSQPIEISGKSQFPDIAARRAKKLHHPRLASVDRKAQRHRVPPCFNRINFGAPADQKLSNLQRVGGGGNVQRSLLVLVFDLDRSPRVQKKLYDVGAVPLRRRKNRSRRSKILRMPCEQGLGGIEIVLKTGRGEGLQSFE